jgi:2-polyprenyl-3-methyl-5-hydroxy-6-metoxy-1,4-benzoquinol methylase
MNLSLIGGRSLGEGKSILFGEEGRVYDASRPQYAAALLLPHGPQKVLDLGSGLGEFADLMSKKDFQVVCVDGNSAFIDCIRARGIEGYVCDLEHGRLPFGNSVFDGIVCLEVIEHLSTLETLLLESRRVLKPNGWLIISTPNYGFWVFRLLYLLGRGPIFESQDFRHSRFYNVRTLKQELQRYGFVIDSEHYLSEFTHLARGRYLQVRLLPDLLALLIILKCHIQ